MTSRFLPSDPVPPADDGGTRSEPVRRETPDRLLPARARSPLRVFRDWLRTRRTGSRAPARRSWRARPAPTGAAGLFRPGEIEYAHLEGEPPFDTDHLVLTDRRLMRVRTDAAGSITQLSQAGPWQIRAARAETVRDRATVTVELHVGSTMRIEATAPAKAQHFVATVTEVVARARI